MKLFNRTHLLSIRKQRAPLNHFIPAHNINMFRREDAYNSRMRKRTLTHSIIATYYILSTRTKLTINQCNTVCGIHTDTINIHTFFFSVRYSSFVTSNNVLCARLLIPQNRGGRAITIKSTRACSAWRMSLMGDALSHFLE